MWQKPSSNRARGTCKNSGGGKDRDGVRGVGILYYVVSIMKGAAEASANKTVLILCLA